MGRKINQKTNDIYPIHVAQVIGKLNAAGVESVINNYYRNIDHGKIQFDYYIDDDSVFQPPQDIVDMGARYFIIPRYQRLPQYMFALIKNFKKNKYKIVHSNMNVLSVFSLCAAKIAGVPVRINHSHSTAGRGEGWKRLIMKYMLRPFATIFATDYYACSEKAGRWLFGDKKFNRGEVKILYNAINIEKFAFNQQERKIIREKLGIQNCMVIGHVGRFTKQKNHSFLIKIFAEIHKQRTDARLMLIGNGELFDDVLQQVKKLELDKEVIFLGVCNDVEKYYSAMDVFCLPSIYEGLPVVAVEAQASGLPVIASDRITRESAVTSLYHILPLDTSIQKWAEQCIAVADCRMDYQKRNNVMMPGKFNIFYTVEMLEQLYMERVN